MEHWSRLSDGCFGYWLWDLDPIGDIHQGELWLSALANLGQKMEGWLRSPTLAYMRGLDTAAVHITEKPDSVLLTPLFLEMHASSSYNLQRKWRGGLVDSPLVVKGEDYVRKRGALIACRCLGGTIPQSGSSVTCLYYVGEQPLPWRGHRLHV
jgi:hypothetical protein